MCPDARTGLVGSQHHQSTPLPGNNVTALGWVWPEMHAPMLCNDAMVSGLLMPVLLLGKVSS